MFLRSIPTSRSRFSLLLLDEREYYFEDFEATFYPCCGDDKKDVRKKQLGRLKICSKSILFAPDNNRYPVMRFLFDNMLNCRKYNGPLLTALPSNTDVFYIRCEGRIESKLGNQNVPYRFIKTAEEYRFSLQFESIINFLPKIQNLLRISQLHKEDSEKQLQHLIDQREAEIDFKSTYIVNISEKTKMQTTGVQLTPLVQNPGRILITDQRLYFQPLNNAGPNPVNRYELSEIERIITRRHMLRHIGLEIFFKNQNSIYLSFKRQDLRDDVFSTLTNLPAVPKIPPNDLELTTYKWRNGTISNYDYLMYLNTLAHRSFNDLTQYPVFPWIISDYTSSTLDLNNPDTFRDLSKPIGALNEKRLESLRMRFKEMINMEGQTPFLYGTHYSTPGYTLYYLVRQAPEYMLRLQSGRFDTPDRTFHSIQETWQGVIENPSDVKELIPEFYSGGGEFLVNSQGLPLGQKGNGEIVNDVILPPWANSPEDFVSKCREALESDYVSNNLHLWIDLIFGFAQRGQPAVEKDNVFYYITYEGAIDIEKVYDPIERKSYEDQINEFGQTPHQLFTKPHPARITLNTANISSPKRQENEEDIIITPTIESFPDNTETTIEQWPDFTKYTCEFSYKLHREEITAMSLTKDDSILYSVAKNGCLKIFDIEKKKQLRNIQISKLCLSSCILSDDDVNVVTSSWDNYIYLYSMNFGQIKEKVFAHEDAISCMQMRADKMVSGSWDSTVKAWQLTNSAILPLSHYSGMECTSEIKSIDLSYDGNICICGTKAGNITLCDHRDPNFKRSLKLGDNAIETLSFSPDGKYIFTGNTNGILQCIDIANFEETYSIDTKEPILHIDTDGNKLIAGTSKGNTQIWNLHEKKIEITLSDILQQQEDISCFSVGKNILVSGSKDNTICVWTNKD